MITTITGFVQSNWKPILFGLIVLGAVLYVENLRVGLAQAETKIVALEAENKTLESNNLVLQSSLQAQTKAIDVMSETSDTVKKHFVVLNTTIKAQQAHTSKNLAIIAQEKRPTDCKDSISYLINANKGYPK